jgi:hypothetical protein
LTPILLEHQLGIDAARDLLNRQNSIIKKNIASHDGREVEHDGVGFIASFDKASKAVKLRFGHTKRATGNGCQNTRLSYGHKCR